MLRPTSIVLLLTFFIVTTARLDLFAQGKANATITANNTGKSTDTVNYVFNLKQCIDYALKNQSLMKNATLGEEIATQKVYEVGAAGLPQISGAVNLSSSDPLRRMFFDPNNPAIALFLPPGTGAGEKVVAIPNFFQLANTGDAGLTITQLIFNNSYLVGLQAAKAYKALSVKQTEQTKIQVIENVTKAYYLLLVNQERIKLYEQNLIRLDSLLFQTKALFTNGMVEGIDVDRLQVTYNNLLTDKQNFDNLLGLSTLLLKYQMNMSLGANLKVAETIADFKVENLGADGEKLNSYSNRIEYQLLQSQQHLLLLDLKNKQSSYIPSLVAFGNIGEFSQSTKFDYFSSSNIWYNYGTFGLTLNVPIFDGLATHHRVEQAKLSLAMIKNTLESTEKGIDVEIQAADITLKNSLLSLNSQHKNIDLAREVARVTKEKYEQGIGSSLEVTTAETSFLEAQTNYYNALYNVLMAKVDYQKALGTLNQLK